MALILSLAAIAIFGAAALFDALSRRIPNRLSLALAGLGLLRIGLALIEGGSVLGSGFDLAAAVGVFGLAAFGFHFGMLGGGDVKLLAAGALWLGAAALGPYLLTTVLAGGVLAMAFVTWHMLAGHRLGARTGPSLPYAVAIAAGGIVTTLGLPWP